VRAAHNESDGVASNTGSAAVNSAAAFPFALGLRIFSGSTSRWLAAAAFSGVATRARSRARAHQAVVTERAQAKQFCGKALEQMAAARVEWVGPACCTPRATFASVPEWAHTVRTAVRSACAVCSLAPNPRPTTALPLPR
jgi:hypothetical protein